MKCDICGEYVDRRTVLIGGTNMMLCDKHIVSFEDYMWEYHNNKMCDFDELKLFLNIMKKKAERGLVNMCEVADYLGDMHEAEAEFRNITGRWIIAMKESYNERAKSC